MPLAILCWQSFVWLQVGAWPEFSTADMWAEIGWQIPQITWHGVQSIIDWVFDLPAAVSVFFLGMAISLFVLSLANWRTSGYGDE
jgi:hypothetical protein